MKKPMTSRERVLAAIEHREPDRVPLDLGGTIMSGITAQALAKLRRVLKLEERLPRVYEVFQMLGEVEPDVVDALGIDVLPVEPETLFFNLRRTGYKPWTLFDGTRVLVPGSFDVEVDSNGDWLLHDGGRRENPVAARMPKDGFYFDWVQDQSLQLDFTPPPLAEMEKLYLQPVDPKRLDELAAAAQRLRPTGKALLLGDWFDFGPASVGSTPNWLCLLATDPEYVERLFALRAEGDVARLEQVHRALGSSIDIIGIDGHDYGTQRAELFSPEAFERFHFPYYKAVIGWVRAHTAWKTWKHTCGSAAKFIPFLIEAGLDCLNPVQCSAAGMDAASLKERFGARLTFWGGAVDTQKTLPFGTPDEVYAEVAERIRIFGPGGGFVFNPIHNVQGNTPPENLDALFRAFRDHAAYR